MIEKEYIDLEETVTTLKRNSQKYFSSFHKGYVQAIEDLADIPAAKVSPVRHGQWVKEKRDVLIHWHCSACKECYYLDMPNAEYCPNCGAKMDGKERDEND